jgi:hypothetical protein
MRARLKRAKSFSIEMTASAELRRGSRDAILEILRPANGVGMMRSLLTRSRHIELGVEMISLTKGGEGGRQVVIPRAREQDLISALHERGEEAALRPEVTKTDWERRSVELLSRYLQGLKAAGKLLPRRSGKVSLLQVAKACGFSYNGWMNYPALTELVRVADLVEARRARGHRHQMVPSGRQSEEAHAGVPGELGGQASRAIAGPGWRSNRYLAAG